MIYSCKSHIFDGTLLLLSLALVGCSQITIKKCCPSSQVIDVRKMKCASSGTNIWYPRFYNHEKVGENEDFDYNIVTYIPKCTGGRVHLLPLRELKIISVMETRFKLLKSGKIIAKHASGDWIDVPENSCIDGIQNFEEFPNPNSYVPDEQNQALISCPVLNA